jgi:hypothetical protein
LTATYHVVQSERPVMVADVTFPTSTELGYEFEAVP